MRPSSRSFLSNSVAAAGAVWDGRPLPQFGFPRLRGPPGWTNGCRMPTDDTPCSSEGKRLARNGDVTKRCTVTIFGFLWPTGTKQRRIAGGSRAFAGFAGQERVRLADDLGGFLAWARSLGSARIQGRSSSQRAPDNFIGKGPLAHDSASSSNPDVLRLICRRLLFERGIQKTCSI